MVILYDQILNVILSPPPESCSSGDFTAHNFAARTFCLSGMEECNMTVWVRGKMFRHQQGAFPSPKLQLSSGGINLSNSVPEWWLTYIIWDKSFKPSTWRYITPWWCCHGLLYWVNSNLLPINLALWHLPTNGFYFCSIEETFFRCFYIY